VSKPEITDDPMSAHFSTRPRWGVWLFLLLAVGLLTLAAVARVAAYELGHADRIYEGVQVAGIPLGGLTLDQAGAAIRHDLTPYPGAAITLRYGDRAWSLAPADLGVTVDAHATATQAYAIGREHLFAAPAGPLSSLISLWDGFRADLSSQWTALRAGRSITPILRYDENALAYTLKRIARDVDLPPQEAMLSISGLDVTGTSGRSGRQVDVAATRAALIALLRGGQGGTADLVVVDRPPAVTSVKDAVARATALLAEPLMLIAEGVDGPQRFAVDRATLSAWLAFSPTLTPDGTVALAVQLNRDRVSAYLQEIAAQMDRPAHDARLDFDPAAGQVIVLSASQTGQQVDVEAGADRIEAALLTDDQREIALPVAILQPRVDSNRIAEMGIVEKVSEGTTYFAGSSRDRVHNIVTAAEKFRGVVIPPGEEFSFNRYVGEITAANGFVEGLIIGAERTAVGIGGGVCQVSTTVFRAAFWGGFPITARTAHGYVVSWYEPPRGLDATIYTPDVDFRFRNDTGHYLLVRPEVDTAKGRVTFYLYGTKVDRTVDMEGPFSSNVRQPEKPIYQEDQTLPAGTIKQVDWAKDGEDVVVTRKVIDGDGTISEDEFVSHYQPWRAVYLYGPGTQLPPGALGEPAATPTPAAAATG